MSLAAAEETLFSWVLPASEIHKGETIGVWFIAARPTPDVRVRVATPFNASIARVSNADCASDGGQAPAYVWEGTLPPSGVIFFCVTPHAPGSLRLVGIATQPLSPPLESVTEIVASDSIVVRDWYELGPTGVGIVSAIAGFIAGLAATFIQKWREDRSAESRARVEIQEALVKGLTTELLAMRDALTTFLVAGGEAPSLGTGAYNTLSKAILAFLNDNERIDYLQRVDELYGTAVANYHHQRNTQARTEILRQAAERVIKQIESLGGLGAA